MAFACGAKSKQHQVIGEDGNVELGLQLVKQGSNHFVVNFDEVTAVLADKVVVRFDPSNFVDNLIFFEMSRRN